MITKNKKTGIICLMCSLYGFFSSYIFIKGHTEMILYFPVLTESAIFSVAALLFLAGIVFLYGFIAFFFFGSEDQ